MMSPKAALTHGFMMLLLTARVFSTICDYCKIPNCGDTITCSADQPLCALAFDSNKRFRFSQCGKLTQRDPNSAISLPLCDPATDGGWLCFCNTHRCNAMAGYPTSWKVLGLEKPGTGNGAGTGSGAGGGAGSGTGSGTGSGAGSGIGSGAGGGAAPDAKGTAVTGGGPSKPRTGIAPHFIHAGLIIQATLWLTALH